MKTWFITGISRGFGLELAKAALARGDKVVGTVRSGAPDLPESNGQLHVLTLDMADKAAIAPAVEAAFGWAGSIDVVVNNAGYGLLGAVESASEADMLGLFEVDVFGPIRVIQAALPHLRAQNSGHILNITSIAGRAPGLGSALYAAAKSALEGLTAALSQEVGPLGIKVTAIAPGAFRTDFLSDHSIRRTTGHDAYAETSGKSTAALVATGGSQAGDPVAAAQAMLTLVDATEPPVHLLLGSDALKRTRAKMAAVSAEIDAWEAVTTGTDYPSTNR